MLAGTPSIAFTANASIFYVSAHPDDFVLFMNAKRDVARADYQVNFIIVTAGDAGWGPFPSPKPYYLARENGSFRAIRFLADAVNQDTPEPVAGRVTINGHSIYRIVYKNTTTWFLRLPDGGDGSGFSGDNFQSLSKFHSGAISTMTAIDGSTTYRGWNDLLRTFVGIARASRAQAGTVWVNAQDYSESNNPGDHADHYAAGAAASAIQRAFPCVNTAYHMGYGTYKTVNTSLDAIEDKSAAFGNYASGMAEKGFPGLAWEPSHKSFLGAVIQRISNGNGQACAF